MSEISRVKDDVLVIFSAHKLFDKMTKRDFSYKNTFKCTNWSSYFQFNKTISFFLLNRIDEHKHLIKLMNLKFDKPEKNYDQFDKPKHLIKFDEPEIDEPEIL